MKKGKRMLALLIGLLMIVNLFGVSNPTEAYADTHDHTTIEETILSDTTNLRATKAAGDTVLAFSSDVHNTENNTAANRMGTMIDVIQGKHGSIDAFGFCGDMGGASLQENAFWTCTKSVMDTVANKGVEGVYTTGNHEFYNGNFSSTSNSVKSRYVVGDVGKEGSNYIIYCLGTDNWSGNQDNFTTGQVTQITNYFNSLINAGNTKPVIVLVHFPLHHYSSRTT